jgi:ABC-type nitrate/sulfonate/bicarbonate transport system permease component
MTVRLIRTYGLQIVSLLIAAVVWEIAGRVGISSAVPPFTAVARAAVDVVTDEAFLEGLSSTALSIAIAFPPCIIFGIALGLLMGLITPAEWILRPYVNLALSLPLVSMIPIILLIFGLSRNSIIAVIVIYVLPVVMVNTYSGVRSTSWDLLEMAQSFTANRWLTIRRVIIPSARGLMLAGLRIGAGRAIRGGIVAEQVIGLVGLGGLVQRLGGAFAVEELYAVIIFIGMAGMASIAALNRIEERFEVAAPR